MNAFKPFGFTARGDGPPSADSAALIARGDAVAADNNPRRVAAGDPANRLPQEARRKLAAIRAANQDARVLLLSLGDRQNEALQRRTAAERRAAELTQSVSRLPGAPNAHGTIAADADHPAVKQAVAQRDAAQAEVDELTERIATIRSRRPSGLVVKIENWLGALPSGVTLEMHDSPVEPPKVKGGDIVAAVDATREKIKNLKADLHAIRSAAIPSRIVRERVRAEIAALAERGAIDVSEAIEAGVPLKWPTVNTRDEFQGRTASAEQMLPVIGFATRAELDVRGILAWLFQDAIIAKLDGEISTLNDDENALDPAERAEREASLLASILATERAEERLITAAAEEGRTIMRRPDADPRAVLGLATSLPAPA